MNVVPAATTIGTQKSCAFGRGQVCQDVSGEFLDLLHARPNAQRNDKAGTLQCPAGIGGVWRSTDSGATARTESRYRSAVLTQASCQDIDPRIEQCLRYRPHHIGIGTGHITREFSNALGNACFCESKSAWQVKRRCNELLCVFMNLRRPASSPADACDALQVRSYATCRAVALQAIR